MSERLVTAGVNKETKSICMLFPVQRNEFGAVTHEGFGTGFLWSNENSVFLVTNWHVATGLNPQTKRELSEDAFAPTHIDVYYRHLAKIGENGAHAVAFPCKQIALYKEGKPVWLEHAEFEDCDVVLIPLEIDNWRDCTLPINSGEPLPAITPRAADHCFVIGYPKGLRGAYDSPIWKGATVATEPDMFYEDRPMFLIDTATRKGMSGSPVLLEVNTTTFRDLGPSASGGANRVFSTERKLIGVYSGRIGSEADGFQLGMVWRSSLLGEIANNGVCRDHPLYRPA